MILVNLLVCGVYLKVQGNNLLKVNDDKLAGNFVVKFLLSYAGNIFIVWLLLWKYVMVKCFYFWENMPFYINF